MVFGASRVTVVENLCCVDVRGGEEREGAGRRTFGTVGSPTRITPSGCRACACYDSIQSINELESAQERIRRLEKKSSSSANYVEVLSRLAEVLGRQNLPSPRTAILPETGTNIFHGDKEKFPTWKEGVLLNLNANFDHYPTDQAKMAYVYSLLSIDRQSHLHVFIQDDRLDFPSLAAMMDLLITLFSDPNRVRDAKVRLYGNRQKNRPFSSWIAEIWQDAAICDYDQKPDVLRDIIFLNISMELQKELIHEREIESLDLNAAIARLQDIDN
ncbi:hypothetical protein K3495_g8331 [Podosphaera aphanis]|nr:hypothetical protein K3495_g8331 [Podosphaera aphanis]